MRRIIQIIGIATLLALSNNSFGQSNIDFSKVIENLTSPEWTKVYKAKDTLEMQALIAIPYLVELLNEPDKYVKLINTADLIYPGAEEFYGHGWVIDYDIDFIAIRAGWVIEELTFQDFGFKENIISDKQLIEFHKSNYKEYQQNGFHEIELKGSKKNELQETIEKVKNWWNANSLDWDRKNAIIEALNCANVERQSQAIQYLRHGDKCIKDLTLEYYKNQIQPIIENLSKSSNVRISEDAKQLLEDAKEPKGEILWSWWIRDQCSENGM